MPQCLVLGSRELMRLMSGDLAEWRLRPGCLGAGPVDFGLLIQGAIGWERAVPGCSPADGHQRANVEWWAAERPI